VVMASQKLRPGVRYLASGLDAGPAPPDPKARNLITGRLTVQELWSFRWQRMFSLF
jgi:hypothetical protein